MNPVAAWPAPRLLAATLLSGGALLLAGWAIYASDRPLRQCGLPGSAKLEWDFRPCDARQKVGAYGPMKNIVLRGLALDTFFFIPSYVCLLAFGCFWAARGARDPWAGTGLALGWGAVVTGALDLIENSGIFLEVTRQWYFAAPLTGTVCRLKWALGGACGLFAIVAALFLRQDRV
jgi:hypothetical protein